MRRWSSFVSIVMAIALVGLTSTTALANDTKAVSDTFYQPGSAGMYCKSESGSISFITGNELLSYSNAKVQEPSYSPTLTVRPRDISNGYIQEVEPTGDFSSIVLVEAIFPDGNKKTPTGFMIGPTGVATTAHSIYEKSSNV